MVKLAGFLTKKEHLRKKCVNFGKENVYTLTISADLDSTEKHEKEINKMKLSEGKKGLPHVEYGEAVQETPGEAVETLTNVLFV